MALILPREGGAVVVGLAQDAATDLGARAHTVRTHVVVGTGVEVVAGRAV